MRIGGECEGCKAKDEFIAELKKMLDGSHQTVLALVDREALKARYPDLRRAPRTPEPAREPQGGGDPEGWRQQIDPSAPYVPRPGASFDDIEATFKIDAEQESTRLDAVAAQLLATRG